MDSISAAICSNRSSPLLNPPPRRGGGKRWGFERSEAMERLERFERSFTLRKQLASSCPKLSIPARFECGKIVPCSPGAALEGDLGAEGPAFLSTDRPDFAECCGLDGLLGVVFQNQRRVEHLLEIFAGNDDAVAAQQNGSFVGHHLEQIFPALNIRDELCLGIKRNPIRKNCRL